MMSKSYKRKVIRIVISMLTFAILVPLTGCQAASDLFNPDTYNFKNSEPWERSQKKKATKPKTLKDQM